MENPYRQGKESFNDIYRFYNTLKAMPAELNGVALDVGTRSYFTKYLEMSYPQLTIINTDKDIDFDVDNMPYHDQELPTIMCFEVLEHLFNPLHFLLECLRILRDNGMMIMTTPSGLYPKWMQSNHVHFHEIDLKRLLILIDRAGFKVKKHQYIRRPMRWFWNRPGIRPLLRCLIPAFHYVEMEKG